MIEGDDARAHYNIEVTKLIPMGEDTCHFRVWKKEKGEEDVLGTRFRALAKRKIQEKRQK